MATTPVLGLRKPARTDLVSVVTDINNNMDIIDQAYDDLSTVSLNIAMTIPANVWSANAPYTYTWLDSRISQKCDIEVGFFSGAESSDLMYLAYEKVPFGIKFTASNKPTTGVPLTIKIINAEAESITSVTGDMVSTSVIPGAANADEALSVLNNNLTTLSDQIANDENKILKAHNFGQYTSLDTFKSDLLSFMSSVQSFEVRCIQFVFTSTVSPFTAWSTFAGYAHCIQLGATSLYFACNVVSNNAEHVTIGYSNGTWSIKKTTNT